MAHLKIELFRSPVRLLHAVIHGSSLLGSRWILSLKAQMGHRRPDMTLMEYAQPVDELQRQLVQRVEDILLGKEPMADLTAKLGSKLVQ